MIPRRLQLEQIVRSSQSAVANVRQRSALNPPLFLCGIVSIPAFAIAALAPAATATVRICLLVVGAFPVALNICAYVYFMYYDRDRLQSEEFIIKKSELEYIHRKGEQVAVPATSVDLVVNPDTKSAPT
jgi:hypothetical protein